MWDTPFETSLLEDGNDLIVSCPEQELEREFTEILETHGIKFTGGIAPSDRNFWDAYKEDFCYFITNHFLMYGPKSSATGVRWRKARRCTFCVEEQIGIPDESFSAILGR